MKMTKEYFMEKAKKIHGDKYDYTKAIVKKKREKICIICPEHGEFWQTPEHHFQGHGCPVCAKIKLSMCNAQLKYTKEDFIKTAKQIHGDKFCYDKVVYLGTRKKVCIICPEHGEFWQAPYSHLNGVGCPVCAKIKRTRDIAMTGDEFIEKARKIHGNKYDYSKVEYVNNRTKVCIICPEHGEFWQTPHSHLRRRGCPFCGATSKSNTQEFIKKAICVHGDEYKYEKTNYITATKKVVVSCKIHGDFEIRPNSHLNGQGCPKCGVQKRAHSKTMTKEDFIEKARKIHGNKYDYSKVEYVNNRTKVCIICPEHGEFWQTPAMHIYDGNGCPKCKTSKLEKELISFFDDTGINYIYQKRFTWLGRKSLDFYLPDFSVSIECQGEQHYHPVKHFGGEIKYQKTVNWDKIKLEETGKHGIRMFYYTHELFDDERTFHKPQEILELISGFKA